MSVTSPYDGLCVGGPWNGQFYRATGKTVKLWRLESGNYPRVIGSYVYDLYGVWQWEEMNCSECAAGGVE